MRRCLALVLLLPLPALAKDLNGRFGVGFSQQFSGGSAPAPLSALSLRYGFPTGKPIVNVGIEANVGVDITDVTAFFVGGRLVYGVVAEDNMNLFLGAGAGYASDGTDGFLRVQPALGAEFFFFGLENLGFTTEVALNVDLGASSRFTTVGGAPAVGMHYYF